MVKIPTNIKLVIDKFLLLLSVNNIPIERAFLFGSHAEGNGNEWSDIDLALVSEIFEGIRIKDRDKIRKISLAVSSSLEILPFHPKDFSEDNPFAKEIIKKGIQLV